MKINSEQKISEINELKKLMEMRSNEQARLKKTISVRDRLHFAYDTLLLCVLS